MGKDMKDRYRLFCNRARGGGYYLQDNVTGKQESLKTKDAATAQRLCQARNEAHRQPGINLQIARAYLTAADPKMATRSWQEVMESLVALKRGNNQLRWQRAIQDRSLDSLRQLSVVETRADHFLKVLEKGKVSTNVYLRRIHNHALAMDWLPKSVIPKAAWPKVRFKAKRAITAQEHRRIVEREKNPERRCFYELCWHLGGSQMDIASLTAEDVDWNDRTICYDRQKLKNRQEQTIKPPLIRFGDAVAAILRSLPQSGPLFPSLRQVESKDRANEFRQRCEGLNISGVTLHSYRYAWAERARQCGYPQRFAQEALGHNSKAVHWAYAKKAEVKVPSLDAWEKEFQEKLIPLHPAPSQPAVESAGAAPEVAPTANAG